MNFLADFVGIINNSERGVGVVVGQRQGGRVVVRTLGGADIILTGNIETGKHCFYDKVSNTVMGEAPTLNYEEYGI